ncbi:MAG: hypothetical protein WCF77_00405 [Minisyncoccia bacterium]
MKFVKIVSKDEFIATFLKSEIDSPRFGKRILEKLVKDFQNRSIIDQPDFNLKKDCEYRRSLLKSLRGYPNREIFENFPTDIKWYRAILTKRELRKAKYINYDYWIELSGGTRLPRDAAKNIENGLEIFKQSNDNFWKAAEVFKNGTQFPELIFVAENEKADPIILEGHLRMTAMMLEESSIPNEIEVIMGLSENLSQWALF